jgi:hypothetical protein
MKYICGSKNKFNEKILELSLHLLHYLQFVLLFLVSWG